MIDLKEFRGTVDEVLLQLGKPQNIYEVGLHNGVVSIANTLLGDDTYAMVDPRPMKDTSA